ncbi:MAG: ribbon-helix-helix protein, CopG family [Chthoniobacteraceae bacterium]|jgi:predicted transcriptional regulator
MSVLTCKLPSALDGRLAELAKRRGVPKSVLVREAIEAKIAEEAAAPRRRPANLLEALGDSVGSIASGKRDLASNKKHLRGFGR